jgi:hypothetical protein
MTPRTLFNIILKIFGLFFLREIINIIPQTISSFFVYFRSSDLGPIVATSVASIVILAFYVYLVMQLLFKTNKFIDLLKLDQGFNEYELSFEQKKELQIGLSTSTILTIALIIMGGIILTDEIPNLCRYFYLYFSQRGIGYSLSKFDTSPMVLSAAKIIIGLLILGERKRVVDFIEGRKHDYEDQA